MNTQRCDPGAAARRFLRRGFIHGLGLLELPAYSGKPKVLANDRQTVRSPTPWDDLLEQFPVLSRPPLRPGARPADRRARLRATAATNALDHEADIAKVQDGSATPISAPPHLGSTN